MSVIKTIRYALINPGTMALSRINVICPYSYSGVCNCPEFAAPEFMHPSACQHAHKVQELNEIWCMNLNVIVSAGKDLLDQLQEEQCQISKN